MIFALLSFVLFVGLGIVIKDYFRYPGSILLPSKLFIFSTLAVHYVPSLILHDELQTYDLGTGLNLIHTTSFLVITGTLLLRVLNRRLFLDLCRSNRKNIDAHEKAARYARVDTAIFLGLALLGFVSYVATIALSGGFWAYYGSVHLSGMNQELSAYMYNLQYIMLPSVLALLIIWRSSKSAVVLFVVVGICFFVLFDAFVLGRRGTYIRFAVAFVLGYFVFIPPGHSRSFRQVVILPFVAFLCVAVLYVTPVIRHYTALGSEFSIEDLVSDLSNRRVIVGSVEDGGNELIYGSAIAYAAWMDGPDYGIKWLFPFVSFIPRSIWPSKPSYTGFSVDNLSSAFEFSRVDVSVGAAATGVADAFARFSYAAGAILILFIYLSDRSILKKMSRTSDPFAAYWCFSVVVGFLYFLLQDFSQGMLAFLFSALPLACIRFLSILHQQIRGGVSRSRFLHGGAIKVPRRLESHSICAVSKRSAKIDWGITRDSAKVVVGKRNRRALGR